MAAAIGERMTFIVQANSTALGSSPLSGGRPNLSGTRSALPVERADQREQPTRGLKVNRNLSLKALHEQFTALIVQGPAPHVYGLDSRGRRGANRLIVTIADDEVVLQNAAQRGQRQHEGKDAIGLFMADGKDETVLRNRQVKPVGAVAAAVDAERVHLQQIENRNFSFVPDFRAVLSDRRFVEFYSVEPVGAFRVLI